MDEDMANVAVLAILDNPPVQYKSNMNIEKEYCTQSYSNHTQPEVQEEIANEIKNQNIIWTKNATLMLLTLYETKMHMLDNPKKKSKMWISIAEELKTLNIEVTPDQVRWKINALTKKYKDCIDNGQGPVSFKYYNEMHQILGLYNNDDNGTYRLASGVVQQYSDISKSKKTMSQKKPFRTLRAEKRAKVELDKQWLEYLKTQEEQNYLRNERYERNLKLKEEELELRKKELELKQALLFKKLQLKERKQEELLKLEKEKCDLLRKLLTQKHLS